jgi:hypothetical protein
VISSISVVGSGEEPRCLVGFLILELQYSLVAPVTVSLLPAAETATVPSGAAPANNAIIIAAVHDYFDGAVGTGDALIAADDVPVIAPASSGTNLAVMVLVM